MRKFWNNIKRFFLPPEGTPLWLRLLPYAILGLLTILVLSGGVYTWTYTNSPEFCGTTCHTMPPEYSAYLRSPHARVACVECHIGRDVITTEFTRKAGDIRHVIKTITQDYEFPIITHDMRPARESCETCHFPEKFSDDSLRQIRHYTSDENNTPFDIYLVMKTGGGTKRQGLGRGIHWHIENEVLFLPSDVYEQDIPYVRVVDENGNVTEYYDVESGITPEDVAGKTLERMDCITCHNRITHTIPKPEEAVDQAISKGFIAGDLPYIRQQAVETLSGSYASQAEAFAAFENDLTTFYSENYTDVYTERLEDVQAVVAVLKDIYATSIFPEQKVDWDTHPDNLGHRDDPGCFRCHDGKHLTGTDEAIRLECNLCHSIPVITEPGKRVTEIEIVSGAEPASHTHTSWISLHGKAIDSTCLGCHVPEGEAGVDFTELSGGPPPVDDSFCGNSACHGIDWVFTGFDSPALQSYLERQLYNLKNVSPYLVPGPALTYEDTFKTIFEGRCIACHSGADPTGGLDLTTYAGVLSVIVPGDPDASLIVERQTSASDHFGQMLTDEIEALIEWILAGAPEN